MSVLNRIIATAALTVMFSPIALASDGHAVPEVSCELKVNEKYQSYDVDGGNPDQLRRQMRQHGTKWDDGATYAAETNWDIRYGYEVAYEDGRCYLKSVKTDVDIIYHLPRRAASSAHSELTVLWEDFMRHLKRHEFGHKDIAVKTAAEINEMLGSLGSFSDENQLAREVSRRTEERFQRMKEAQIAYDHDTRHGESQGAVLPDQ